MIVAPDGRRAPFNLAHPATAPFGGVSRHVSSSAEAEHAPEAMPMILRLAAVVLFIGLMALLLGPAHSAERSFLGFDKVAHFVAFGLMVWCLGVLIRSWPRLAIGAIALFIGIATEVIQGMTGRDAELLDVVADGLGVAAALLLWSAWRGFAPRRHLRP